MNLPYLIKKHPVKTRWKWRYSSTRS